MKRTLAILLCALLLIPAFAVCAFAAEPGRVYNFTFNSSGIQHFECNEIVPSGIYNVKFVAGPMVVSENNVSISYDFFDLSVKYAQFPVPFPDGSGFVDAMVFEQANGFGSGSVVILTSGGTTFGAPDGAYIEFEYVSPLSSPGRIRFVESIKHTLNVCIEWVGKVTTALISGELNGLLLLAAIPIAITVVMLSIKFIRRNSWGC